MQKPKTILLLLIIVLFGAFVFLESTAKAPIDWSYSFWKTDDKPFGAEIFQQIFVEYSKNECKELNKPPYQILTEDYIEGNYLFFNSGLSFGSFETNELLCFVEDGNNLFLSAEYLPKIILDTFGLKKERFVFNKQFTYQPSVVIDTLQTKKYDFKRNLSVQYFKNTDSLEHKVLGYAKVQNDDSTTTKFLPNFIKIKSGRGQLFLHLFPQAFTNFFLVEGENVDYTNDILKALDFKQDIYVDQYYKDQKAAKNNSLLQYLVGNKHLRWAYYLVLLTALIYVFFEGKRKQKPIEILKPYKNKTYAFTQTIADMYYRKKDHKSIATKQIEHFYAFLRDQYHIPTVSLDDDFVKQLASKSGKDTRTIKTLLKNIKYIESKNQIQKDELLHLEKQISKLKK